LETRRGKEKGEKWKLIPLDEKKERGGPQEGGTVFWRGPQKKQKKRDRKRGIGG